MSSSKKNYTPLVFVIVSLVAIGVLVAQYINRDPVEVATETYADRIDSIKEADLDILSNPGQDPKKVHGALMRRAQTFDPKARVLAEELVNSPKPRLKEAAYQALGFYNDEKSEAILVKGLETETGNIRIAIIRGLGFRQTEKREAILQNFLDSGSLSEREMIMAYESLVKASKDKGARDKASHGMLKVYKKTKSPAIKSDIIIRLTKNNRTFEPMEGLLLESLKDKNNENFHSFAIRQLAAYKNKWLKENIANYITSKNFQVKSAAIGVIPTICPKSRWELLEKTIFEDRDRRVQQLALFSVKTLKSQNALVLLTKAIESNSFSKEEVDTFKKLFDEINATVQQSDTCVLHGKSKI